MQGGGAQHRLFCLAENGPEGPGEALLAHLAALEHCIRWKPAALALQHPHTLANHIAVETSRRPALLCPLPHNRLALCHTAHIDLLG